MPMLFDPFEQLRDFQRALDEVRSSSWLGFGMSAGGAYRRSTSSARAMTSSRSSKCPGCASRISTSGSSATRCASPAARALITATRPRCTAASGRPDVDRAVTLPINIDADKIKAECRDGILALYLPRAERDKPRAITVS